MLLKDGTHGTHKDAESGPLLLSAKNIKNGTIQWDESDRRISEDEYNNIHSNFKLQKGDVLLTIVGSIGETAILSQSKGVTFQRSVAFLRPSDKISSEFLYSEIQGQKFQKALNVRKSTSAQPGIYLGDLGTIPIEFPTSDEEQMQIGSYFQNLDNLITLHQCKCQIDGCRFQSPLAITWEQRKVREVTDRYDNLRIPVAASLRVAGTTPYYGANGIQDYVDGYTHDGEFILVAEDGANDLKNYPVKCVKGRIWVNNHAHVLQGKYDCADNQFLAYAISQADIESLLVGGGRAKLNAETLMGIDLLLPNKAEQIRIGKYLAQLDNLITLHQCE